MKNDEQINILEYRSSRLTIRLDALSEARKEIEKIENKCRDEMQIIKQEISGLKKATINERIEPVVIKE